MSESELIQAAAAMYGGTLPDGLRRAVVAASRMVQGTTSVHWDSGNCLRSTQVLAGIVAAYQIHEGKFA